MKPSRLALATLTLPAIARAQAWQADLPADSDGGLLMIVVCLGVMAFHIRACARVSLARAHYACFIWVTLSAVAAVWPPARIATATLAVAFLVYGFWRVT